MAVSGTSILYIVELALYALLVPCTIYLAYRHGRHGVLGYSYLNASCLIRIAADAVNLADGTGSNSTHSIAGTVLSALGLSPLLLTLAGFLDESHYYYLQFTIYSDIRKKKINRWLWHIQFHLHTICLVGVILLIIGSVKLATATSASDVNTAETLRKAGAVILLVLWVLLVQYNLFLIYRCRLQQQKLNSRLPELNYWILLATLFVGVKVAYVVAYAFDPTNETINPVTGSVGVKAGLVVLPALLAVMALTYGGWRSLVITKPSSLPYARDGRDYDSVAYHNLNNVQSELDPAR